MKYDCSRILDYIHERDRICRTIGTCDNCPLYALFRCDVSDATQETIDALQKWSDEHPEQPRLTKKEYNFLATFLISKDKVIGRKLMNDLYVYDARCDVYHGIDPTMLSFIREMEQMTFDELLSLEVEE